MARAQATTYADVAAHDAPPPSQQPHPDPSLLEGHNPGTTAGSAAHGLPDVDSPKVDDAARQAQNKGQELKGDAERAANKTERKANEIGDDIKKGAKDFEKKASRAASDAKKEASQFWQTFSNNPEYWASTLASVNLVLLGAAGAYAYTHRDELRRTDRGTIAGAVAGVAALLGIQAYAANEAAKKQGSGI